MLFTLTQYWHGFFDHIARARERRFLLAAKRAMGACSCEARASADSSKTRATRSETLKHIALYAQAGYFSMGYPVDVFQAPVDGSSD
jgi:hypothetical protein